MAIKRTFQERHGSRNIGLFAINTLTRLLAQNIALEFRKLLIYTCFVSNQPGAPKSMTVKWGFCIPSTCTAGELEAGLRGFLNQDVDVSLSELDCHTNKAKEFKTVDYIAM